MKSRTAKSVSKSKEPKVPSHSVLLRSLPFGVLVLQTQDPEDAKTLKIVDLNPAAARITLSKREDLLDRTLGDFPRLLPSELVGACQNLLRTGQPGKPIKISIGNDLTPRETLLEVFSFNGGAFLGLVFEDLADRKGLEQELYENEERLRVLIQDVQEYAILQLDKQGNIVSWNAGAERLEKYRADEIIGKHFSIFYPEEDVEKGKPEGRLAEAAEKGQSTAEGWRIRKDGSRFWANVVITALRDSNGQLRGFTKVTRDMTEWREREEELTKAKELLELRVEQRATVLARVNHELRMEIAERQRAEEQLRTSLDQLRALAGRLQTIREAERTSISREIHDEFGQACTAIKMDLAIIRRRLPKQQTKLREKVDSTLTLVDSTIASLRRVASELRPTALDDLGLPAALEVQAQEFEGRTGISCRLLLPDEPIELDTEKSTAVFRIFQESLTNVARHAQATQVRARLEKKPNEMIFEVSDNGIGFEPEKVGARKSLGIVGMQERAILLKGELKIVGVPGAGTTLQLKIPLEHAAV